MQDPRHVQGIPHGQRPEAQQARIHGTIFQEPEAHLEARGTSFGGTDEEATVESNPRLLEDPTGRVCKCASKLHNRIIALA